MASKKAILIILVCVIAVSIVIGVLTATLCCNGGEDEEVIVHTQSGSIKGLRVNSDVSSFYAFFRIPYAKPPVNELRFKAPSPIEPWSGVLDATTEGPACVQADALHQSEDCLIVNVYTRDLPAPAAAPALARPVYVHLHFGGLQDYSANSGNFGPDYFMRHDVVLVMVQFRLAMLGFLNLNSQDAPGNMGLADTIEALRWVHRNIESFGGDPRQVTLGGISSGGIMTHALLMSPQAQGLIHKAIIQSGTALSYRFYHEDTEPVARYTKQVLNMPDASNEELLAHLMSLTPSELIKVSSDVKGLFPRGYNEYYPYPITRDLLGIIPENPIDMVRKNNYTQIPMIIGITSDEGIRLEVFMDRLDFVNNNFYMVVPTDLYAIDDMSFEKNETAQRIKEFYFGDRDLSRETFPQYAEVCRDSWYGHITDYVVRLQGSLNYSANVYYYVFAIDGAYNTKKFSNITSPGASHADDRGYLFKINSLANVPVNDDFSDLARDRMVAMWVNFIIHGNPTIETTNLTPVEWKPVRYPEVNYLLINRTISLETNPYRENLQFWQRLYGWMEL
ncbi:esterase FE4 [Plutella xylostella]|uniref:esterase FE4 n=1 Tax=Plutella xylostella TaxID=51655 RepID=UPI0020326037|nr:esterase FE4 [Plutella xylostella]